MLSSIFGHVPFKVVFHQGYLPSKVNGHLLSEAVFHQWLSPSKGYLPSKVIFHGMSPRMIEHQWILLAPLLLWPAKPQVSFQNLFLVAGAMSFREVDVSTSHIIGEQTTTLPTNSQFLIVSVSSQVQYTSSVSPFLYSRAKTRKG